MQNKHLSFAFSSATGHFGSLNRRKSISEEETANVKHKGNKKRPSIGTGGTEDEGQMKIQKKRKKTTKRVKCSNWSESYSSVDSVYIFLQFHIQIICSNTLSLVPLHASSMKHYGQIRMGNIHIFFFLNLFKYLIGYL